MKDCRSNERGNLARTSPHGKNDQRKERDKGGKEKRIQTRSYDCVGHRGEEKEKLRLILPNSTQKNTYKKRKRKRNVGRRGLAMEGEGKETVHYSTWKTGRNILCVTRKEDEKISNSKKRERFAMDTWSYTSRDKSQEMAEGELDSVIPMNKFKKSRQRASRLNGRSCVTGFCSR